MTIYSLRSKLLIYTLTLIILSMLAVGYYIDKSLLDYHNETAKKVIQDGFNSWDNNLKLSTQELIEHANIFAQDKHLIASLNLITKYQNPLKYNPILFDVEKKKIIDRILPLIKTNQADEVYVFDGKKRLAGFASSKEKSILTGFMSYESGKEKLRFINQKFENQPNILLSISKITLLIYNTITYLAYSIHHFIINFRGEMLIYPGKQLIFYFFEFQVYQQYYLWSRHKEVFA